jgi:hypothetical protein
MLIKQCTDMFKNKIQNRAFVVPYWSLAFILLALQACSSPPKLSQVQCCTAKPINSDEWVAKKTREFQEHLAKRESERDWILKTDKPVDEDKISQELEESDAFIRRQKAKEEARAAQAAAEAEAADDIREAKEAEKKTVHSENPPLVSGIPAASGTSDSTTSEAKKGE